MGMTWLANKTPTSEKQASWNFLQMLLGSDNSESYRTIKTSSNGVVYAQLGNVIDEETDLIANSWFVIKGRGFHDGYSQETYYREYCFQTDGNGKFRIKYSPRKGFNGGLPSVIRVPSATDERLLLGGGTDASPTFADFVKGSGYRLQGYASEIDDSLFLLTYPIGGGVGSSLLLFDNVGSPIIGGVFADKDPFVLYHRYGNDSTLDTCLSSEERGPRSVFLLDDLQTPTRELWGRCPVEMSYVLDTGDILRKVFPIGGSSSLIYLSPSYPESYFRYVRRAAVAGTTLTGETGNNTTVDEKRYSKQYAYSSVYHANPTLLDSSDPLTGLVRKNAILAIGHILLPWNGTALDI